MVGKPISIPVTATGGAPPLVFSDTEFTFATPGTHTATITVTDANNTMVSASTDVEVSALEISVSGHKQIVLQGSAATVTFSANDGQGEVQVVDTATPGNKTHSWTHPTVTSATATANVYVMPSYHHLPTFSGYNPDPPESIASQAPPVSGAFWQLRSISYSTGEVSVDWRETFYDWLESGSSAELQPVRTPDGGSFGSSGTLWQTSDSNVTQQEDSDPIPTFEDLEWTTGFGGASRVELPDSPSSRYIGSFERPFIEPPLRYTTSTLEALAKVQGVVKDSRSQMRLHRDPGTGDKPAITASCLILTTTTSGATTTEEVTVQTLTIAAGADVSSNTLDLTASNGETKRLLPMEIEVPDIQDTGPVLASNGTGSGTPTDPAPAPTGGGAAAASGGTYEDPTKTAAELKIARMEGIYSGGQLIREALDANHFLKIDNDPDRFRVRMPSIGNANAGPVFVKIATEGATEADHNDNPTIVELKSNGFDGDWVTDWQLLVSQHTPAPSSAGVGGPAATDADDKYTNTEIATDDQDQAQGQIGDRTHVAELGSDVVIKAIKIGTGSWTDMNLKIPVKVKREIPITFVKMNDANADIARDLKIANERWAQVGIKFTSQGTTNMAVPAPLTNSDIMASDTTSTGVTFGAQPKKLADTYSALPGATPINGTRVVVFYCKDTRYPQANTLRGQDISGFATYSAWINGTYNGGGASPTAPGYENIVFMSERHWKPFTLAHELGHLLTNEGHFGRTANDDYPTQVPAQHTVDHNLMIRGTAQRDGIGVSKRLLDGQRTMVERATNGLAQ